MATSVHLRELDSSNSIVESDQATIEIRPATLSYFVATRPMRLASPLGLVTVATGDHVVASETGELVVWNAYAFELAFVPVTPPPA